MSDQKEVVPEQTLASVRESFMYAQLACRGLDTNMFGTPLTAALSRAFDVWLEGVRND